jgi:carbonic anhydrase
MQRFRKLFENNDAWAHSVLADDPDFFRRSKRKQEPHFLWIGCADSRVPAEAVTGSIPGDIFVHRNIGNQVWDTDLNLLSVLHYAVNVLQVKHVIVCGHTNCGAIKAAYGGKRFGIVDHWLSDIRNVMRWYKAELDALDTQQERLERLSELNVLRQVEVLARTPTVGEAWARRKRPLLLHGLVYDVANGHLRSIVEAIDSPAKAEAVLPRL